MKNSTLETKTMKTNVKFIKLTNYPFLTRNYKDCLQVIDFYSFKLKKRNKRTQLFQSTEHSQGILIHINAWKVPKGCEQYMTFLM